MISIISIITSLYYSPKEIQNIFWSEWWEKKSSTKANRKESFMNPLCFYDWLSMKVLLYNLRQKVVFKCIKKPVLEKNRLICIHLSSFSIPVLFVPIDSNTHPMHDEFHFQRSFHDAAFWIVDKRCAIETDVRFCWTRLILLQLIFHIYYLRYW